MLSPLVPPYSFKGRRLLELLQADFDGGVFGLRATTKYLLMYLVAETSSSRAPSFPGFFFFFNVLVHVVYVPLSTIRNTGLNLFEIYLRLFVDTLYME